MRFKKRYLLIVPVIAGIFFFKDAQDSELASGLQSVNHKHLIAAGSPLPEDPTPSPVQSLEALKAQGEALISKADATEWLSLGQLKCLYDSAGDIPRTQAKLFPWFVNPSESNDSRLYVSSKDCPPFVYSVIEIDSEKKIKSVSDCRQRTIEQQRLEIHQYNRPFRMGTTSNVKFGAPYEIYPHSRDYFQVYCSDGRRIITRYGKFFVEDDGILTASDQCVVMGRVGEDYYGHIRLKEFDVLGENGCFTSGPCLAMVDPKKVDPNVIVIETTPLIRAYVTQNEFSRFPASEKVQVIGGAYEEQFDHKAGIWNTGLPAATDPAWLEPPEKSDCNF